MDYDDANDVDLLVPSFQAKWFTGLLQNMVKDISKSWNPDSNAFDPNTTVDSLIEMMKSECLDQGKSLHEYYFESLEELKNDRDFIKILKEFEEGANGERNILKIGIV